MPDYYPEGNQPLFSDTPIRSLQKINSILTAGSGSSGVTSVTGTLNQVIVSGTPTAPVLSTPQNIATTSAVQFASLATTGSISTSMSTGSAIRFPAATNTPVFSIANSRLAFALFDGGSTQFAFGNAVVQLFSGNVFGWGSSSDASSGLPDTAFARNVAGVVEVNNGTAGTFRDLKLRNLTSTGVVTGAAYSVAGTPLPSAATSGVGSRAFVADATSATFGATYAGGGANKVPVYSDGTNWLIG